MGGSADVLFEISPSPAPPSGGWGMGGAAQSSGSIPTSFGQLI